jgi:type II secretory pathway pseudopilin PulG
MVASVQLRDRRRPIHGRGFTLLELINLISLAAVLITLGMVGLARYTRNSKTAEAVSSVGAIAQHAAAYYDSSEAHPPPGFTEESAHVLRRFPPSSASSIPADPDIIRGAKYQSAPGDWAVAPWRDLGFSIQQPQYYMYSFESQGVGPSASAAVTAHGDLDGDGTLSRYRLSIAPDSAFHATVGGSMEIQNPLE